MPKAVSLFTGCGGSDRGLIDAGFDVVMANDTMGYARDVYLANLPETDYVLGNVADVRSFPEVDLLAGCYPCQGFSVGGVREAGRKINYLYREFDRALRQIKPKAFIVENVSGMRNANNQHLAVNQLTRFRMAGYKVDWSILDARAYGVAQERTRMFFVGIRSDLGVRYEFPQPTHSLPGEDVHGLPSCPTIRDRIEDLPLWPEGEYDNQPFHWYYLSRDRWRDWGQVSRTIVANSRHTPLHPVSPRLKRIGTDEWRFVEDAPARRLSYREAARLQGFGDMTFPETGGTRLRYRVIGNAVPPPLFKAVASAIPDIW
ncbi:MULTISPECIES: DNA cytosine methyltransferase [Methylobacteriaceae]|uniref:Cytosine-specific methyltransferase n=2 Tax=Methylobacteriaceae TaxID=119045 RepID=A0AA37HSM8_9HYPH|nr:MULTISPECIES: DNA (cytosine-5-)-methyltransferase [Methylobacteriaceae]MDQ0520123.1 DNA (cytosine-5)-methyltransferase 1 [Methylobacterium gregans]BAU90588.1 DNA-cytosine methyltransferase family protein [Methylorubrum populi]GJD80197.1 Modification methylase BspRI [Methylobacterium gregans]GLS52526.1 site-specific DNA-methyltransferase [Methylobacterium gregans]